MKMLLLFAHDYWLKPFKKTLPEAPDVDEPLLAEAAVLALVHVEATDAERHAKLVTKSIKQIKWLAGKFETRKVILHSFAHLASSSADPKVARELLSEMQMRLMNAEYDVHTTPFGYFNEFRVHVAGPSLAKVFVEL